MGEVEWVGVELGVAVGVQVGVNVTVALCVAVGVQVGVHQGGSQPRRQAQVVVGAQCDRVFAAAAVLLPVVLISARAVMRASSSA